MERSDHFGAWLRQRRKVTLGLTQAELADLVFCSKGMIAKIESGDRRPARELAGRLVAELGIPPGERIRYVSWARGLSLPASTVRAGEAGQPAGDVVRMDPPVAGYQDWVLVPLDSVIAAGLSLPGTDTCTGMDCNGKDPEVTGCATTSFTAEEVAITGPGGCEPVALVELRFSRVCQTNWARITRLSDSPETLRAYLRGEDGEVIAGTIAEAPSGTAYAYGFMWYAPTGQIAVQACGVVNGHDEVCTRLR